MKNILLISIGSQSFVLPEALAVPSVSFDEVHVLTTDQPLLFKDRDVIGEWKEITKYVREKWDIPVTWSIIKDLPIIQSGNDHRVWTEVLYRWAAEKYEVNNKIYYCLSGGTKTMPASCQQVANLYGAEEVYHVLVYPPPKSITEVENVIQNNQIEYVSLGGESGWTYLIEYASRLGLNYEPFSLEGFAYVIPPAEMKMINYVRDSQASFRQYVSGHQELVLPFTSLMMLPRKKMEWLHEPLRSEDRKWVEQLPKIDLHTHLGGFATKGPLLEMVRASADNPDNLKNIDQSIYPRDINWPLPEGNISLTEYMRAGDNTGSTLLKDLGCLRKHIQLMYSHFIQQNVCYVEVRCSPYNYAKGTDHSAQDVLDLILETFNAEMEKHDFQCLVKILIIATRKDKGDLSDISKHLSLAVTSYFNNQADQDSSYCSVVGVDLAGYEFEKTRAEYFEHDFSAVHRCGLAVTAHAGENDDAEGIWQAVYKIHSRRIGHGLRLLEAPDLLRSIVERGIGIEMCPYANYQIVGFAPMKGKTKMNYPLREYLDQNVKVSVNTDNIGISEASLTDNFLLLTQLCPGITRLEVLKLIMNSVEISFAGKTLQNHLIESFNRKVFNVTQNHFL